jgi:hypothetical protein
MQPVPDIQGDIALIDIAVDVDRSVSERDLTFNRSVRISSVGREVTRIRNVPGSLGPDCEGSRESLDRILRPIASITMTTGLPIRC